jgi:hypothetical protein
MAQNANAAVTGKTWKPITVDCNKVISDPDRQYRFRDSRSFRVSTEISIALFYRDY